MVPLVAQGLVVAGILILAVSLAPVRHLIARLPAGAVRSRWYAMAALIVLFVAGYGLYLAVFWSRHSSLIDLIVPAIFFFGACFVWLSATLSLQTAIDLIRIGLLERETVTDSLTGLFNRRYLDRRLDEEIARARRYGLSLSLLMLDVDHFKRINDAHGHQAGDAVLVALGRVVGAELRETDVLGRYGGEEFFIITPQTPMAAALGVAERVRASIETHHFALPASPDGISITASIGLAALGDTVQTRDALLKAADANLYRAKQQGRNRVLAGA
jgi:diguanylate cyclase (GGDEF)-like protein